MKTSYIKGLVIFLLLLALVDCQKNTMPIVVGEEVEVTIETIGPGGGTISVSKPGDPLDGFSIKVSEGSYSTPKEFKISYKPIIAHAMGKDFEPISPLIIVENGGDYAQAAMSVKIPAQVPDGYIAVAFLYDDATGAMEPAAPIGQSDSFIVFATAHFSGSFAAKIPIESLNNLQIDTKFKPGVDTWQIENKGSFITPGGNCQGMSLGAMWYYVVRKKGQKEQKLSGRYESLSLSNGLTTPQFEPDDDSIIRLCSVIQHDLIGHINIKSLLSDYTWGEHNLTGDPYHFYATAAALKKLQEPLEIVVYETQKKTGHALICYKIDNYTLYVADPNKPNDAMRTINFTPGATLEDGKFQPYSSVQNVLDILEGGALITYDEIMLAGKTCLTNVVEIGKRWADMEGGLIGKGANYFPDYILWVTELDANGRETNRYGLDMLNDVNVGQKEIDISLEAPFEGKLSMYKFNNGSPTPVASNRVTLEEGSNLLGFYVEGKVTWETEKGDSKTGWRWAGFDWVNINYTKPPVDLSGFNQCTFRFSVVKGRGVDSDGGEYDKYINVDMYPTGTFSGNTFNGTEDRECGEKCKQTGTFRATVDPCADDPTQLCVTSFKAEGLLDMSAQDWTWSIQNNANKPIYEDVKETDRIGFWGFGSSVCDYFDPATLKYREQYSGSYVDVLSPYSCDEDSEFEITFNKQ